MTPRGQRNIGIWIFSKSSLDWKEGPVKRNSLFVCLFVCLCQVKVTFFLVFQRSSRGFFWGADHETEVYLAGNPVARPSKKLKFDHQRTTFSNDHFSDVISRGELESHLESLEIFFARVRKLKFDHQRTTFSNDHFSDVISRGELESHLESLELLFTSVITSEIKLSRTIAPAMFGWL